jgi:hypothetical protein
MAISNGKGFIRRVTDHMTDELVIALSGGATYEFKELFKLVYAGLKEKNAVSGGEEMLRLRCYEKLQSLTRRGLAEKKLKSYRGLKGIEQASSVHQLARSAAAISARAASTVI